MPHTRGAITSASSGTPPVEQLLVAAIERRRHFGTPDASVVDVERDLQIAFDTIERADDRPAHVSGAPARRGS
jgi:hypothetical protein